MGDTHPSLHVKKYLLELLGTLLPSDSHWQGAEGGASWSYCWVWERLLSTLSLAQRSQHGPKTSSISIIRKHTRNRFSAPSRTITPESEILRVGPTIRLSTSLLPTEWLWCPFKFEDLRLAGFSFLSLALPAYRGAIFWSAFCHLVKKNKQTSLSSGVGGGHAVKQSCPWLRVPIG